MLYGGDDEDIRKFQVRNRTPLQFFFSVWLIWLSTHKCTREIQRISGKAAKVEIARGSTSEVSFNRTVLQGATAGLVRQHFVSRIK